VRVEDDEGQDWWSWGAVGAVAVIALLIGALGMYYLTGQQFRTMHAEYEKALLKVEKEAQAHAIQELRGDVIGIVERVASDEAVRASFDDVQRQVDRAHAALAKVELAGAKQPGAKGKSKEDNAAALTKAQVELGAARAALRKRRDEHARAQATLRQLTKSANRPTDTKELAKDLAKTRAGLAQAYAELAEMTLKNGDRKRAERLLRTAILMDPANRERFERLGRPPPKAPVGK
jgi:hypothetical protein